MLTILQHSIREEAETFPDIWIRKNRKIRQNKARHCIADFLKADPDDVVFIENVTAGTRLTKRGIIWQFKH